MGYRKRVFFTDNQKAEFWVRWQGGESMSSIGRVFDRGSSLIYPLLERAGGIRPAARMRSRLALTFNEREEISRGLVAQHSLRFIARKLHRAPSTISREVRRNGGTKQYRATRSIRRSRHATLKCSGLGKINDAVSIRERPADVEDRAELGRSHRGVWK